MCGLLGIYGNMTKDSVHNKKNFAIEGMVTNSLRGFESTGIALIPNSKADREPETYKRAVNGMDFTQMNRTKKLVDKFSESIGCMIHNRASTRGVVRDSNAHPFTKGHITLMHNGTLHNFNNLSKAYNGTVDSEAICWAMAETSAEDVLPRLDGAFSLVWWDAREGSLNFARNGERPMYWIWAKDKSFFVYGSEYQMLWWLADRNNIDLEKDVKQTSTMQHYKFMDSEKSEVFSKTPFYRSYPQQHGGYGQRSNGGTAQWPIQRNTPTTGTKDSRNGGGTTSDVVDAVVQKLLPHVGSVAKSRALIQACGNRGVPYDKAVTAFPKAWTPYPTSAGSNDRGMGKMACKHVNTQETIIVHSVHRDQWEQFKQVGIAYLNIIGFQDKVANTTDFFFIGIVCKDLQEKLFADKIKKAEPAIIIPANVKEEVITEADADAHDRVLDIKDAVDGPDGKPITRARFRELTERGCANCSDTVLSAQHKHVKWITHLGQCEFLCPDCSRDPKVLQDLHIVH